ncbi:MAG: alanine racemase [Verrucomicrobiales bacterium]|nr:alanine racemase [Verrucomicrobiales bacterium]MCP5557568.1 alanine racemase [Verrucomicrobiaceae bacterium]
MSTPLHQLVATSSAVMRPTYVEVDQSRVRANLQAIRAAVGPAKVMGIVKANAYGHGIIEIARLLEQQRIDMLGVAFLEEAVLLREHGIQSPILVFGGIAADQIHLFLKENLSFTASSVEKLRLIDEAAAALKVRARVHLKIDTGMERIGVHYYSAGKLLDAALQCDHCDIDGIYSHFANADAADLGHAQLQLERFLEVTEFFTQRSLPLPCRHIANSGGVLQLPDSHLDMVRPGILLYGVYPSAECARTVAVQSALSWKSRVAYFKVVQPGHPVSYGSTWQSDHPTRIVTIPAGYGDGYFRALSNRSVVIIRGKKYPVVGRVCMDQMMVNIEGGTAYNGDEVILLGETEGALISAEDIAEWAGTISYEVLTNINTRVPRVYVG